MEGRRSVAYLIAAAVILLSGLAAADQITLGESKDTHNVTTYASFTGMHADSIAFSGTCGAHPDCLVGYAYDDALVGQYQFWIVNGSSNSNNHGVPELGAPNSQDYYDVIANGANFQMQITFGGNVLTGLVTLDGLQGGSRYPEALGDFTVESASGSLFTGWNPGTQVPLDFTIKLGNSPSIDSVWNGVSHSTRGPISGGEIPFPTPEPGCLALLGSGLTAIAGVLRRRLTL